LSNRISGLPAISAEPGVTVDDTRAQPPSPSVMATVAANETRATLDFVRIDSLLWNGAHGASFQ
jgi:hypothetical protein